MNPKQFQERCIALVRSYKPAIETPCYLPPIHKPTAKAVLWSINFRWTSGLECHLHFARGRQRNATGDWVHFGLIQLGEERARELACQPLPSGHYCWWKWNIHVSGSAADVKAAILVELERRLNRCAELGVFGGVYDDPSSATRRPGASKHQ